MGRSNFRRRHVSPRSHSRGDICGRSLRLMDFIELHSRSAFSFLRAASHPEQLVERAAQLQMPALALCDRDGVYGAPRLFARAKTAGVRPIVGAELTMEDKTILPV